MASAHSPQPTVHLLPRVCRLASCPSDRTWPFGISAGLFLTRPFIPPPVILVVLGASARFPQSVTHQPSLRSATHSACQSPASKLGNLNTSFDRTEKLFSWLVLSLNTFATFYLPQKTLTFNHIHDADRRREMVTHHSPLPYGQKSRALTHGFQGMRSLRQRVRHLCLLFPADADCLPTQWPEQCKQNID